MKLKMPKGFNKWLQMIEPNAKYFMWVFGMLLATATVVNILPILTEINRLILMVLLILFFFAGLIVFISDLQGSKQKDTEIPAHIERSGRNRWISIGLLVLGTIVIGLIFVARQLPPTPQGYQAFLTAFAGVGAWVIGIALAVFAYQQYKLRQTEHRLLFEPQVTLSFGNILTKGTTTSSFKKEPYTIEFTVMIQNSTQLPVLIEHMQMYVILDGDESGKRTSIAPADLTFLETAYSDLPLQVTLSTPRRVKWIMSGSHASYPFDYLSGESGERRFRFIFTVFGKIPQGPRESTFFKEAISWPIHVPQDANWVSETPFLDAALKDQKGGKTT